MAFVKKTWKDRIVQYANRRLLTKSGGEVEQVTVTRDEGTVTEAGDKFDAATMNDLEDRLEYAFNNVSTAIECTQAEYDTWKNAGQLKPQTSYIITDAPNLNPTADDIEYQSGVTVADKLDDCTVERQYYTGTTSGYGNIALGGEFDSSTKVIISATARNKANTNTVYIADIYQNDVNQFGTTYGLHVRNITDNSAITNTVIEGYIWLVKFAN